MFIDEVKLSLIAWKWWDWSMSFRREKYIAKWWPYWWDWGKWWDIILKVNPNLNTLSNYRHKKIIRSNNWEWGWTWDKHWANWGDLILEVPIWTIIKDLDSWEIIHDLKYNQEEIVLAKWWRWWYWNAHFVSSTRQAPRFAELWDIGEELSVHLELKLVADIWLVWMPSAWKSTLIWVLTNAKPKTAEYHFTTLSPNLWILDHKWKSIVIEDVPWLIPGASEWKWLWIKFLKHIERTWIIIHMLDISRWDEIFEEYTWIRNELEKFSKILSDKKEIILLSKIDEADSEIVDYYKKELEKRFNKEVYSISSFTHEWLENIKDLLIKITPEREVPEEINEKEENEEVLKYDLKNVRDANNHKIITLENWKLEIKWDRMEQIVRMTDCNNHEAIMRVYDILEKKWIDKEVNKIFNRREVPDNNRIIVISWKEFEMNKVSFV